MRDVLSRVTGLIALVSALALASIFFIPDEDTAEFMLIFAPLLSVSLIPAMHRTLKTHKPTGSLISLLIGITGISLLIGNYLLGMTSSAAGTSQFVLRLIPIITIVSLVLVGVWIIGVNLLTIQTKVLPAVLASIGILMGIGWILVTTILMITSITGLDLMLYPAASVVNVTALIIMLAGYFIWALGTGFYFVTGRVSPA